MTDPSQTTKTYGLDAAIRILDPNGGWDYERLEWPYQLVRALREAEVAGYTEYGVSFGNPHWRLTDDGISERARLEAESNV